LPDTGSDSAALAQPDDRHRGVAEAAERVSALT
jgi:hypothetical protein